MNWDKLHSVYFLGIGGIGMSAIARWFNHIGIPVSGYDRTPSPLTRKLEEEGMRITYEDNLETIPDAIKSDAAHVLIVWTPAIPKDSVQLNFFVEGGFDLKKRSEVLGMITSTMYTVGVAGTHGKTTTSSMVAHMLKSAGKNIAAFLGGLTQNYESNLILHDEENEEQPIVVVEADEFDRSFLRLHPNVAVVTSVDADHLDIYGDAQELTRNFEKYINLLPDDGLLFIQKNALEKLDRNDFGSLTLRQYGLGEGAVRAENIKAGVASFDFDYISEEKVIKGLVLKVPGFHNVENALASISIALHFGVSEEAIRKGLVTFKGVKRRFEIKRQDAKGVFIDDYAHHPEEIKAFLGSVKAMYPDKKLTAVFQPHLYTRTRDFADGFSEALSLADEVVLLDIYPAREKPIAGVSAQMLMEKISAKEKSLHSKEGLLEFLDKQRPEVLVTLGAGDIDRLVEPINNLMEQWD
ncbi:UDP-N-acetylmuramate--L-alanine ligase [Echinicola strongylocentroti]|uniref:UDP-N-acetylmuramate--L-alanine ligase n=1 Tax=Echinicola strongylocentroti TaxID=1795355 RepID=A0A2Z4II31_9BACT|nr:UDP-N-acetylmuramate--L-alanine ligase [Echinicola strongylocentroti]AWW30083.1 UDP-N-acetylmuramate--L-alanine ligase [Echinicola strongylocentroti]